MGCGSSSNPAYLAEINALKAQLRELETKSHEQQNLLRFKVEVLVNMLAVEEKRNENTTKRLETLKWLIHSQGISEDSLTSILLNLEGNGKDNLQQVIDQARIARINPLADLAGAIDRMREEFVLFQDDILHALALTDGKIVTSLPANDFMKQVYTVTENISKVDLQILALRFDDGRGFVSVPEFIEFFITPATIRTAKAAASAVRMSLDLFSLDIEMFDNIDPQDPDLLMDEEDFQNLPPEMRKTHLTDILDRGAKRLLVMWIFVREDLEKAFTIFRNKDLDEAIQTEVFHKTLMEVCGKYSHVLEKVIKEGRCAFKENSALLPPPPPKLDDSIDRSNPNGTPKPRNASEHNKENVDKNTGKSVNNQHKSTGDDEHKSKDDVKVITIEPLEEHDAMFLAERFELAGFVHYGHFLSFFNDTHRRFLKHKKRFSTVPDELMGVSPFRYSQEWNALKASSILRQSKDNIRMSQSMDKKPPLPTQKSFTAPKKVLPPVEEKKPEPPKKVEPPPEPKKEPEPPKAEEKKEEEPPKAEEKKQVPPPTPPPPKTAPVVESSGCFLCGGGKAKPANPPAPAPIADAKDTPRREPSQKKLALDDTPMTDFDAKPAEGKHDTDDDLAIKQDHGFSTPRGAKRKPLARFDSSDSDTGMLPHREGLGKGRNDDTPVDTAATKNKGSRFRRRAERDFDQERPMAAEDIQDMEEDAMIMRK